MNAGYRRTDADAAADADPENRARTLKTYWNTCAEKAQGRPRSGVLRVSSFAGSCSFRPG